MSYKVTFNSSVVEAVFHRSHQLLAPLLVDAEKTYNGLTAGCAAAGKAGCKLLEFTGDNVSGDLIKTLLNDVHDVTDFLPRTG